MVSRMILVGLVALLGVSLPSQSESDRWLASAHEWVIAQLAEWDISSPGEDGCFDVAEAPNPLTREDNPTLAQADIPDSVTFEPIPITDDPTNRLVDELNRWAEGLDIPEPTTGTADPSADLMPVSSSDSIEWKLVVELYRVAEASAPDETHLAQPLPQPREAETSPAIDEIFADASQVFAPPEHERDMTAQSASDPITVQPGFDLIQPMVDHKADLAAELNRFAEGLDLPLQEPSPRPAQTQSFEPIKVPANIESGMAYELNRASNGMDWISPEAQVLGEARPGIPKDAPAAHLENNDHHDDASVGKALGLTRDAALAWMNVFTGMTPDMMTSQ